jgi:predicted ribonuclease YlaK
LDQLVSLLQTLSNAGLGIAIIVPDTNALLYNPAIEDWRFDEAPKFRLVLTPPVLSELDEFKVIHRVPAVRRKAERLIRQIKEYRRRGSLLEGVVLRGGVSYVSAIAAEPDMANSLPWLDKCSKDDRLLACVIELMRANPNAPGTLVTRDVNLQHKAEMAHVSFLEPPEPPERRPRSTTRRSRLSP